MLGYLLAIFAAAVAIALARLYAVQRRELREAAEKLETLKATNARAEGLAKRNQLILDHAMDGFFVLDEQARFIDANPAFCRVLGYSRDELLKLKITDIEARTGGVFGATGLRTGLHHFPTAHRARDGRIVQLESSVIVLRDQDRKLLVGFARDVTERVATEDALRRSEEQYRNVVETSRDLIWALDAAGRWTFLNGATLDIYGFAPEELMGQSFLDRVAPEDRDRQEQGFQRLKESHRGYLVFDATHVRRDGQRVELTFNAIVKRDELGAVQAIVGTAADVSNRKRAEDELREAHARFEAIKSGMPLGYVLWALDGSIRECNRAARAILGVAADQPVADKIDRFVAPVSLPRFEEMRRKLERGERQASLLLSMRGQDGTESVCEWFSTLLLESRGESRMAATILRDVSERERLESQLRQSQKLESLGVLAGGVAHDFNNLLVGILGNASLALERVPDNSAAKPFLRNVSKAANRATELTRHMLTYAGRAERDVNPLDLNTLIREMAEFMAAALPKNVKLEIDTAASLPRIDADSGQMQQVVMNLLMNAAEACSGRAGVVRLTTATMQLTGAEAEFRTAEHAVPPGNYVVLRVADNGCGMSPETLSRIFEPFFTTKFTGRGLGLASIRGIVRAHAGGIHVESAADRGTTFTLVFPVGVMRAAAVAPGSATPIELPKGVTILVIDDEEAVRDVVRDVLESRGVTVLDADSGERGIELFRRAAATIDAVLLDLTMPGMTGEAVFRELQLIRPDVRVVVSSGYSERETASRFRGDGLAGVVPKPYTAEILVRRVAEALTRTPRREPPTPAATSVGPG